MPWTKKDYPVSMKNLPAEVRNKAIEIGNTLLEETNMEEGIAIATAISRAKDWAAHHHKPVTSKNKSSRTADVKKHGEDVWVTPYTDVEWAVKKEGRKKTLKVTRSKTEAVKTARQSADKTKGSLTIQNKTGRMQKRESFTPQKRTPNRSKVKRG